MDNKFWREFGVYQILAIRCDAVIMPVQSCIRRSISVQKSYPKAIY